MFWFESLSALWALIADHATIGRHYLSGHVPAGGARHRRHEGGHPLLKIIADPRSLRIPDLLVGLRLSSGVDPCRNTFKRTVPLCFVFDGCGILEAQWTRLGSSGTGQLRRHGHRR